MRTSVSKHLDFNGNKTLQGTWARRSQPCLCNQLDLSRHTPRRKSNRKKEVGLATLGRETSLWGNAGRTATHNPKPLPAKPRETKHYRKTKPLSLNRRRHKPNATVLNQDAQSPLALLQGTLERCLGNIVAAWLLLMLVFFGTKSFGGPSILTHTQTITRLWQELSGFASSRPPKIDPHPHTARVVEGWLGTSPQKIAGDQPRMFS